ncbi:MAG TPA: sulfatase-like hydrolase/transferase, partial [Vicinamibacteria bacterium]|nr:sulfatase-like hydrolase/transferase [Vicinamibacteria bacterium]
PHFPYDPPPPFNTRFGPDAPLDVQQRRDRAWYTDVNQGRVTPTAEQVEHLRRLYEGNLAYADQEVGALRRALEEAGLWDRTVLIVTADHGEQLYEHGYISHSAQVYEESVRVPLILRLPAGTGPRGARLGEMVDLLDLAPTVVDVMLGGAEGPAARAFQGRSLLPLAAGAAGKASVLSRTVWDRPVYALRDARYKLIYDSRTGEGRLFDLQADPGETRDLARERPLRAEWYRQALQQWVSALAEGSARTASAAPQALSREQCENLKSLGYTHASCPGH